MASFGPVHVCSNADGWGPRSDGADLDALGLALDIPMTDFSNETLEKLVGEKWGKPRVCDFTLAGQKWQEQRAVKGKGKGKGTVVANKDDEGFVLVDTQIPVKNVSKGRGGGKSKGRGKSIAVNYQEGILGQMQKPFYSSNQNQGGGKGGKGGKSKGFGKGKGQSVPTFKEWSVTTKTEWEVKREIQLSSLTKLQLNAKDVKFEDVCWCGRLDTYSKEYDRLTAKIERPIRRFEDLNFFNVSTSDDPILTNLLQTDEEVSVIATDQVLAVLIAAARSVYSWDIVVTKIQNKLIFDKRDGSPIDLLTVNESAKDPPSNDSPEHMNSPIKLGQEASCINQNFSQMVLDHGVKTQTMDQPNPFEEDDEGGRAASGAYRYRTVTLPGNPKDECEFNQNPVKLAVRTEINAKMPADGQYVSVKALNEFDPKLNYSWRTALETQRGAVLATELKNNAFKLGRWTAQSMLSGSEIMKIGYASRARSNDPWSHVILGVQTYYTDGFAEQIGMNRNNAFGILRTIIDIIMSYETSQPTKYLVMKDPTKPVIRVYEIPWDTFAEEEDDGEEEDDDDDKDLDEDGNEVPQQP